MPHLTIEHSANLSDQTDLAALCRVLHRALLETGLFELGAIRIRALAAAPWLVADGLPENAFADLRLRIGAGRSEADRQAVGARLMAAAEAHFADLLARPHFALSLDVSETDARFSWKRNAIHPRLRGAAGTGGA